MSDINWKTTLQGVAPVLAGLAGGPFWAGAVKVMADRMLGDKKADDLSDDEAMLARMLSGGIPAELRAQLIDADRAVRAELIRAGVERERIAAETERAYVADVSAARSAHAHNMGVLALGYVINLASYATVALVLYGCYSVMAGSRIAVDAATAAMIGSVIGAAVQWLMSNAAQANGFFFGSSPGSRQLARDLGTAVGSAVQAGPDMAPRKGR